MKKCMKKLILGTMMAMMTLSLVACSEDSTDNGVRVEVGDVETDADVTVEVGDTETDTDESVESGDKVRIDKYIGGTGKDLTRAGYKYVGYSGRNGDYIVQYVLYDIEPEIKEEFNKLQGQNIAKLLIKNEKIGLGYKPNGEKYLFTLNSGSVYMNFELVGSEKIFEQYRDVEVKKIRDMGELHSIPIVNLRVDYMYCYARFDESGSAIINTDNFTEETAQQMLGACKVEDFYYQYGLSQ